MAENWTVTRSKKAAITRMNRDPNAFRKMGSKGGKRPKPKRIEDLPKAQQYEPLASEPKA